MMLPVTCRKAIPLRQKQTLVKGSSYTVAEVPASVSGSKDGVNGTFSFNGWKKDDGTVLTGEQQLTADLTLHGVWSFTKKILRRRRWRRQPQAHRYHSG